jgi:hypothetical protein
MRWLSLVPVVLVWALGAAQARASVTYQYVTDQTSYTASTGTQVTVDVFLQEVLTGTSTSIITAEGGLFGAGFLVSQSAGQTGNLSTITTTSMKPNLNAVTGGTPPGFGTAGQNSASPTTTTQIGELENAGTAATGPTPTNITSVNGTTLATTIPNAILLGQFTITAGGAGTTTTYQVQSYNHFSGATGNTLTEAGTDLDVSGTAADGVTTYTGADMPPALTYTFTVVATPEPSSVLLCGLPACGMVIGLGYAGYRRRKATHLKASAAA